jgi:hypothetical protein
VRLAVHPENFSVGVDDGARVEEGLSAALEKGDGQHDAELAR